MSYLFLIGHLMQFWRRWREKCSVECAHIVLRPSIDDLCEAKKWHRNNFIFINICVYVWICFHSWSYFCYYYYYCAVHQQMSKQKILMRNRTLVEFRFFCICGRFSCCQIVLICLFFSFFFSFLPVNRHVAEC